jgi:predicted outer membrane repeat protein
MTKKKEVKMKKLLLITCGLAMSAAVEAQIIHVPDDYPTIQQGINAATPGDTVLVADGTYYEQINFLGKKPLMVASEFLIDCDTNHIVNTIIDGSQLTDMDSASVVYFVSGEDTTSILCGFTIRNGKGTYTPDNLDDRQGGGIWISEAGAKILNNRIRHNIVDDTQAFNGNSTTGGGIGTKFEEDNSYWVVIANNSIDSNACISQYEYAYGGGICISYNSRIFNNFISSNTCSGLQYSIGKAGGIGSCQDFSWTTSVFMIIEQNTITRNLAQSVNNAGSSAGAVIESTQCIFSNNEVTYNTVITGNTNLGGGAAGLLLHTPDPGCVIRNNIFMGNSSNIWAGGMGMQNDEIEDNIVLVENNYFVNNEALRGGAFLTFNARVTLQNNVFLGNHAEKDGGVVYLQNLLGGSLGNLAILINNSFFGNSAEDRGGVIYSAYADPLVLNSIFWQDTAAEGNEIFVAAGVVEIAFSNLDTNNIMGEKIIGAGMINADPLFNDLTLLTIESWSPCVDIGTAQYISTGGQTIYAPSGDILGIIRPLGNGYDMGAYEMNLDGISDHLFGDNDLFLLVYPNPSQDKITISSSAITGNTQLSIFNVSGEKVLERQLTDTETQIDISALPRGVYFVRVQDEKFIETVKMIKQ